MKFKIKTVKIPEIAMHIDYKTGTLDIFKNGRKLYGKEKMKVARNASSVLTDSSKVCYEKEQQQYNELFNILVTPKQVKTELLFLEKYFKLSNLVVEMCLWKKQYCMSRDKQKLKGEQAITYYNKVTQEHKIIFQIDKKCSLLMVYHEFAHALAQKRYGAKSNIKEGHNRYFDKCLAEIVKVGRHRNNYKL